MRVGTGVSSSHRIYTATLAAGVVYQLASLTGNAKNPSGATTLPIVANQSSCVQGISIRNTGATNDYYVLSDGGDTAAAGYPVKPNESASVDIRDGLNTWLVSTSGTTIAVWEV
jgi:hypothetical protein